MQKGEIVHCDHAGNFGAQRRDKISEVDQVEMVAAQFEGQHPLFEPAVHRRVECSALKVCFLDQRLWLASMLKNNIFVVAIDLLQPLQ